MAYRVVVAPVARDDLIEIGEYIAQDSPDNARQWVAQLGSVEIQDTALV